MLSALSDNISKSLDDPANIGEVDLLIRSVDVRLRSANTHRDDLSLRVLLFELLEEGNRAAFSESSDSQTIEIAVRGLSEACIQPGLKLSLLPSAASVTTLKGNLGVVGNIS